MNTGTETRNAAAANNPPGRRNLLRASEGDASSIEDAREPEYNSSERGVKEDKGFLIIHFNFFNIPHSYPPGGHISQVYPDISCANYKSFLKCLLNVGLGFGEASKLYGGLWFSTISF